FHCFTGTKKPRRDGALSQLASSGRNDVHEGTTLGAARVECDMAVDLSKDRVILAQTNANARMELSSALTDDDVAGQHRFAAEALDAQALGLGITTVASTTACLLMCHDCAP